MSLTSNNAPNPRYSRNWSSNKGEHQHYQTFWQLCINKHGLRPPPFSLFVNTQPPFCHGTPVRDCLRVAEPCLGLGPKPDNLTVIHSKLIKHLQRCHDGERALFISVLHHQHARADLVTLAASQSTYANETAAHGVSRGLTTRLVYRNYKQIFIHYGWSSVRREVPGSEAAYKLFFCWTIIHWAGSDSVVKVN